MISFYNEWHLGDCFNQLLFQRRLFDKTGKESTLYCKPEYIRELSFYNGSIPIKPIENKPSDAIDSWIGHIFYDHPLKDTDQAQIWLDTFKILSDKIGVDDPVPTKEELWIDYPEWDTEPFMYGMFDVMVVNSRGLSGQTKAEPADFIPIIEKLRGQGRKVITTEMIHGYPSTRAYAMTLRDIGSMSKACSLIVGIQTAPMHATFNVWNKDSARWIILNEDTYYDMGSRCKRVKDINEAFKSLS